MNKTYQNILNSSRFKLNNIGSPKNKTDKSMLIFMNQGAWIGYNLPNNSSYYGGSSDPFLMAQDNSVWLSTSCPPKISIGAQHLLSCFY